MLGIYDTGLGGFTLIPEIKNIFPTLDITFLADTEALPLGEKTDQEIKTRVFAAVDYLWSRGCEVIILACNTATCICIQELQSAHPQKSVLGITRTLTESLERRGINKDKIVSILGTTATIQSGYYQQELNGFGYHDLLEIPSKISQEILKDLIYQA
jgi:glutamate racemase